MKQAREKEEANASVLEGGLCFSSCQLMRSDYHKITSSSSVVGWGGFLMSAAERTLRHTGLRGRDPPGTWEHLLLPPSEETQKMEGHGQWLPGGPPHRGMENTRLGDSSNVTIT